MKTPAVTAFLLGLDAAVAGGRGELEAMLRRKDAMHRRWFPSPSGKGCILETAEGCDLFRLL